MPIWTTGGFYEKFTFERGVATWFFDVYMFAGLDCHDSHPCVPVIGRNNNDGINFRIFEDAPEVFFGLWGFSAGFLDEGDGSFQHL